jgi:hypothetical protein
VKCRHRLRRDIRYWVPTAPGLVPVGIEMTITRCARCDVMLPLGASNDADERVGVEIRAASMVACHETDSRCRCFDLGKRLAPIGREREACDLAAEIMYPDLYARHVAERDEVARVIAETSGGGT